MEVKRNFDILDLYRDRFQKKPDALAGKFDGSWVYYSSEDYVAQADAVSRGLLAYGLQAGDRIVTITPNRPEWNILDMGMAQVGMVHVPIFPTLGEEEYRTLLPHADPRLVLVGSQALHERIAPLMEELPSAKGIHSIEDLEGVSNWKEIRDAGNGQEEKLDREVKRVKEGVDPDDTATLIYTSGTTGGSKGVLLSHRNLVSNAKAASEVFELKSDERYLCILPLCHVGERMANYQTQISGCSIYYNQNIGTIAQDMQEVQPHGFGAVPRILERVYDRIVSKASKMKGIKRKLFFWSLELGKRFDVEGKGIGYKLQLALADKLIFKKWREAMGGRVRCIGVGGAALPSELERVFWAADIKLLNMYGLTETSPIITINRKTPPDLKLGTVGTTIPDVKLELAEDGEVLCKGPNVMKGYFKDEAATKEAFDEEGWFRTGDIGELVEGRFLRITDRKKSLFKLSNGKYISPAPIEEKLKASAYVDQAMVIGEGKKFTSALIVPHFENLEEWCQKKGVSAENWEKLIEVEDVEKLYKGIVEQANAALEKDEKLRRHRLVPEQWSPESGELSPTLKIKRRVLLERYADTIQRIFGD